MIGFILASATTLSPVILPEKCREKASEFSSSEGETEPVGVIEGVKIDRITWYKKGYGGDPFFDLQLVFKDKTTSCFILAQETFGYPSIKVAGRAITLTISGESYSGDEKFEETREYLVDPKGQTLTLKKVSNRDLIKEMNDRFYRSLKGQDIAAMVRNRDEVVDHFLNGIRDFSEKSAGNVRVATLKRGFELANEARKGGRCEKASDILKLLLGKSIEVPIRQKNFDDDGKSKYMREDIQLANDVAFVLTKCGEPEIAVKILKELLEVDPDRKVARRNLSEAEALLLKKSTPAQ
jgi:hypothetical protein